MTTDWVPFGFLPLHKPVGPTSHDMVARMRRLLPRKTRVGHTGTLDPFASGVMIIGVGKATRFSDDIHKLGKSYRATIRLGQRTDTLDNTGSVDLEMPVPTFDAARLEEVAAQFRGDILQMPPIYSAKKVDGRKAYDLARENKAVELKPVALHIHELKLQVLDAQTLICDVTCSTGTYIRSLGRDIGEALGTCAHLTQLVRTSVGGLSLDSCVTPDDLTKENLGEYLIKVSKLLPQIPEIVMPDAAYVEFIHGRAFATEEPMPPEFLAICQQNARVQGIFRCQFDPLKSVILPKQLCYQRA